MVQVSITHLPGAQYPSGMEFAPSEPYPEYPFGEIPSSGANDAYEMVRCCLHNFGADASNYGNRNWNPLGRWIKPGDKVFVLPNLVMHRRPGESPEYFAGKCTHGSVLQAVLDYATLATGDPSLVSFGNSPLQGCDYAKVSQETGATAVAEFYGRETGQHVGPHDLRLLTSQWTRFGAMVDRQYGDSNLAVDVDLGRHSMLEALYQVESEPHPRLRVGDYSPGETESYHSPGSHVYVVNRRVLEADVIVSAPKLKTHQKVGITCALKGTVGTIARKECLAHHRQGGPEQGGDEYPHSSVLRDLSSALTDRTASAGTDIFSNAMRVGSKALAKTLRVGPNGIMGGAWHGNDTAWRMVLDIARILRYADANGVLHSEPVRKHLGFVDGIVAGEGEGPLTPAPRHEGVVLFSEDVCALDYACATVMGFDPELIPLVSHSFALDTLPITDELPDSLTLNYNGRTVAAGELRSTFQPAFVPPKGWQGRIEAATR